MSGFEPKSALVLLSGGQDSAVCLAWALSRYPRVETIGFDYAQRHAIELSQRLRVREGMAALSPLWGERLGPDRLADMRGFATLAESALTADLPIVAPEGALPNTFVPGRNLAFLAFAGAHAAVRRLDVLVGGMCETDYSGYPDCRRATIEAMQLALTLGLDRAMPIETPLMRLDKAATWGLAEALGGAGLVELILEETHTCYRGERGTRFDWGYGCGDCPACVLRAEGWRRWRGETG